MKKLLHLFILLAGVSSVQGQQVNTGTDYKTALGVKLYPGALSVKHFIGKGRAVEGLGYLSTDGFRLAGLYELHFPITGAEGLQW